MTSIGRLAMQYSAMRAPQQAPVTGPGCGRMLGHGESCSTGHLCGHCTQAYRLNEENEALQALIEGLSRDAMRYRYLRVRRPTWQTQPCASDDAVWVDQQIDKAIGEQS